MINFVSMGIFLTNARKKKHLSQELVAELVDVSVHTIRNIEHGDTFPRMETVLALWDIYDLPRDDIWKYFSRSKYVDEQLKKLNANKERDKYAELTLA